MSNRLHKSDPLHAPALGDQIPRWRFGGTVPNLSKMILIGALHISNWDFPLSAAPEAAGDGRCGGGSWGSAWGGW